MLLQYFTVNTSEPFSCFFGLTLSFSFFSLVPVDYKSDFFASCISVATQQEGNGSFVSPTALGNLDLAKDVPKDILSQSYPGALSDF